jgi:hypothetical protein
MDILEALNKLFSHRFAPLVAFIAIAAVFAVISQHQVDAIKVTQGKQAAQAVLLQKQDEQQANLIKGGCVRLNIELADENRSHFDDYDFYSQVYNANKDAKATNAAILKKFGIKLTPKLKQDQNKEIARLKHDIDAKTWTPLLNCNTISSARYHLPQPIPFVKRLPPKSDLKSPPNPPTNPGHQGVNN